MLAETGRVSLACEYARLSKQSAYALRARDPVFAAGWDAACELARAPLADALYEQALDGTTDTLIKDGQVVATRHRHDSRLSIAVLNRLDKRCDRAMQTGAHHLAIVRRWDEWLNLVGKGEEEAARILLETSPHGQPSQLPLGKNPTDGQTVTFAEDEILRLSNRFWREDHEPDGRWLTSFKPPPGWAGDENRPWAEDRHLEEYERECTAEEIAALEAAEAADLAAEREEEEELRDAYLAMLRDEGLTSASGQDPADEETDLAATPPAVGAGPAAGAASSA